jgi:hypothetical protein
VGLVGIKARMPARQHRCCRLGPNPLNWIMGMTIGLNFHVSSFLCITNHCREVAYHCREFPTNVVKLPTTLLSATIKLPTDVAIVPNIGMLSTSIAKLATTFVKLTVAHVKLPTPIVVAVMKLPRLLLQL